MGKSTTNKTIATSLRKLSVLFCMLFVSAGAWAQSSAVAQIGDEQYESLADAFENAAPGETVKLLQDVDATGQKFSLFESAAIGFVESIIFDGNGHTLTVDKQGLAIMQMSSNAKARRAPAAANPSTEGLDVTIKNITIRNVAKTTSYQGGHCITTRGDLKSLTLEDVILTTEGSAFNRDLQPLFIGGDQSTAPVINITNSTITTGNAVSGKETVAISLYNPAQLTITGSTLTAQHDVRFYAPSNSAGAAGSVVNVAGSSTLNATGSAFYIQQNNVLVNVENSTITCTGEQSMMFVNDVTYNSEVKLNGGNAVTVASSDNYANGKLTTVGGNFDPVIPDAFLAEGYICKKVKDTTTGKYLVTEGEYTCFIGETGYSNLAEAIANVSDGKISEGKFNVRVPYANCAAGRVCSSNKVDGYYVMTEGAYVAKVGDYGFASLDDAFAAAGDAEILLVGDAAVSGVVTCAATVTVDATLNLNGMTLNTGDGLTMNSGTLTLKNGQLDGDVVANGGTLVFDSTCGTNAIAVTGNSSLNLTTGKFNPDIDGKYLADHYATNLISGVYVVGATEQISTVAQLQALATYVLDGNVTSGKTYELTADLDLTGVNWTPIGNVANYPTRTFKGTFDGKGHTISNLKCVDNTAGHACAALFGSAKAATIKNLTLANVDIQSTHYAGAFVAYTSEGTTTIENCHVVGGSIVSTPELIGSTYDNGNHVGGIIGYSTNVNIVNCSVEEVSLQAYRDLGGLAGFVAAGSVEGNSLTDVTLTQDNTNGYKKNADGSLQDMSTTVDLVVGGRSGSDVKTQANDVALNKQENVVISNPVVVAKIGTATYPTLAAAVAAAAEEDVVEICQAGTYTIPDLPKNITIKGAVSGVIFNCEGSGNIAAVPNGATFENVTMKFGTNDYHGFHHSGEITMKDCTLNGKLFNYNNMYFEGCTFNAPGTTESGYTNIDYCMWTYGGNATYTNCTFNSAGKVVNVYNDQQYSSPFVVKATNCTFNSTVANKAAFNVKATSGNKALLYEVTVEDCSTETPEGWPAASSGDQLVVLSHFVQVDDINPEVPSVTDVAQVTTDPATGVKTEEVLYTTRVAEYDGTRYDTFQEAIDAAEAADDKNIVINLLNDATLDITAWSGTSNPLAIGTANTESITINGNGKKLTFNKKDSDWNNVATMNDAQTKLVLNNMTISDSGYNDGPWNRYDINFNCSVELNDVIAEKALAFKNDATLNNVTVTDTNDVYGIWIQTTGQSVTMNEVSINVPNGRGIAVKDQYIDEAPAATTSLELDSVEFTTAKKAAILVTSLYGAEIEASNLDIANVAADHENAVWVDEDRANQYGEVTLNSSDNSVTMIPEGGVEAYTIVRKAGEKVEGYYKDIAPALAEAKANQIIELKADVTLNETQNSDETAVSIVANGHTITLKEGEKIYTVENTYADVIISPATALTKIEAAPIDDVYCYSADIIYYAQIGDDQYRTLQAALDAVAHDYDEATEITIQLINDIDEETVTVGEYKNFKVTIDGAKTGSEGNYKFYGQFNLDGRRASGGSVGNGASITLQNIAFVQRYQKDAIISPSNSYTHHVTIQNCSYDGNAEWTGTWFIQMYDVAYYFNVNHITAKNTRFLSGKGYNKMTADDMGLVVENVTATEGISAVFNNLKTNHEVLIQNNTIVATKYVLRDAPEDYEGTITLKNNNFTTTTTESDEGVIYTRRTSADNKNHIRVESGSYVGKIAQKSANHVVGIAGGHFSVDLTEAAYADFIADEYVPVANLYADDTTAPHGVKHAVAKLTNPTDQVSYYLSVAEAFNHAEDGAVVKLIDTEDTVALAEPLNLELAGKNITFDLNEKTLSGRTNLKSGALTLQNGFVAGGNQQALNVYGSSDTSAENYSVLTIADDVTVTADVYGVCLFGKTYSSNGYGAVINIAGTVETEGTGAEGAVFVSGNLGKNVDGDMNNVINITGSVTSENDAAIALNGNATVNVQEGAELTGNTAIAVKRGTLNVTGGTVTATGEKNYASTANHNGTEMTGAAVSMSSTYNKYGAMAVNISGGTFASEHADALYKAEGAYTNAATFAVSGGVFSSIIPDEYCVKSPTEYVCQTTPDEEGMYAVAEGHTVAKIGATGYATLEAAMTAAQSSEDVIVLVDDLDYGTRQVNITKAVTIDGQNHSIKSTAAQAVQIAPGNFDVTLSNLNIDATKNGLNAGTGENSIYTGKLSIDNSTFTVGTRGINLIYVGAPFHLNLDNSTVQLRGISDYDTEYSNADTRGINPCNFSTVADGRVTLNITNSTIQGFAYDINLPGSGNNIDVTMTGGKTAGRAALNIWGHDNTLTLDGVEVHGLNNETGPTEAFACIVENTDAVDNAYNINNVTFIANIGDAALSTTSTNASQYLFDTRGANATIKFFGHTTYSSEAEEKVGLMEFEYRLYTNGTTVLFDEAAKESLKEWTDQLTLSEVSNAPVVDDMYPLNFTAEAILLNQSYQVVGYYATLADAMNSDEFADGFSIYLLRPVTLTEDITCSLTEGEAFYIFTNKNTITKGDYTVKLNIGVTVQVDEQTDIFSTTSDDERAEIYEQEDPNDVYFYTAVYGEVLIGYEPWATKDLFENVINDTEGTYDGAVITFLRDVTLDSDLTCGLAAEGSLEIVIGEQAFNTNGHSIALADGVTILTDKDVDVFVAAETGSVIDKAANGEEGYSYTAQPQGEDGIFVLTDGVAFSTDAEEEADKITYKRTFRTSHVGKYQAWFVPFDYTITEEDLENFDFYKLNQVSSESEAGEVEDESKVYLYIKAMTEGETLRHNRPYIVKPKEGVAGDFYFVSEDVTLYPYDLSSRLDMSTAAYTCNFFGNYEQPKAIAEENTILAMQGGTLHWNDPNASLPAYRWYISVTARSENADYTKFRFDVIEGEADEATSIERMIADAEGEVEGYYTVDGKRIAIPQKGLNIVRFSNGVTKKVYVK